MFATTWYRMLAAALMALVIGGSTPLGAVEPQLEARVWLDRGHEPILRHGDRVRLYYRANRDAFVSIFHLDTNGRTRLVFPRSPRDNHRVRGGRDYRLLFPGASYWNVLDDPGVGYYFAIASERPFDFGAFGYASHGGWDLGVGFSSIYHDPYVAMDDFVAALIPGWEYSPYALDFASYSVGRRYDFPRFLCYDCHGFRRFDAWNPYLHSCNSFRVVIYNDPWFYPAFRYRGRRVVFVRPPAYRQPRFVFKERGWGEPARPLVRPRPATPVISSTVPPPPTVGRDGRIRRANPRTSVAPPRTAAPRTAPSQPARPGTARPGIERPGATRPGTAVPGTTRSPSARPGSPATRPANPSVSSPRGGTSSRVLPPRTRPTQVLPGRGTEEFDLRRRTGQPAAPRSRTAPPSSARPSAPTRPSTGVRPPSQSRPPSQVRPPTQSRPPSQVRPPSQSRPPSQVRPPSRVRPPTQSRPPSRVRPPTQSRPPSRVRPPTQSRPPARTRPPAQARPPTRPPARPPRRPPGGGPF